MLKIAVEETEAASIIAVEGEVDLYSSPDLRKALLKLAEGSSRVVIIDLAGVPYMDSSGLATLIEAYQRITGKEGVLKIISLQRGVRDVFQLSNLDSIFEIHDSLDAAMNNSGSDGSGD